MKRIFLMVIFLFLQSSFELPAQYIWNPQQSNTSSNLNCVNFIDDSKGLICGDNGIILKTTNKGENWFQLNSNTNQKLNFIHRRSGLIWIVGDSGVMLKSSNEGISWIQVPSGTTQNINSMDLTNLNLGHCPCDNGIILRTTNSGINWLETQSVVNTNLNSIARKVICGDNGIILSLSNNNWLISNSGVTNDLLSVSAVADGYLYVISGKDGILLNSSTGFWNIQNSGTTNDLNTINRASYYQFIFSVGNSGTYIKSADAGQSWSSVNLPTTQNINGGVFIDQFTGWIVGNNGTILSTKTRKFFSEKIDGNNILTWYTQNGQFNFNDSTHSSGFEWPRGSGKHARYSSAFLIGAVVNNDTLIVSGDAGNGGEFLPGYTSNNGQASGKDDSLYKIYKLKYGVLDDGRMSWPNSILFNSDQGAPVYLNTQTGMWEPNDYGNQTIFFRMTDSYPESHFQSGGRTSPLKADVKCINFSFHTQDALDNVIYSDYQIINRSNNVWRNTYFTFFSNDDTSDDGGYLGSDTLINLGFCYGRSDDPVYGTNPPAVGFKIIRGANYSGNQNDTIFFYDGRNRKFKAGYKTKGLHSFNWFYDDGPGDYFNTYNSMEGKSFRGGHPIITPNGDTTRYYFSGDPETNIGWIMPPSSGYRRTFTTTGPVNVNPGDTQHIVIAQVIAQGINYLNSVTKLKESSLIADQNYNNFFENVPIGINNISSEIPQQFSLYQNYPNPFNPSTTIRFEIPKQSFITLKLFDVTGREIASLINQNLNAGYYEYKLFSDKYSLSSGAYYLTLKSGNLVKTTKIILLK
ncbi:MAG: YCF48-related protein [Bacteroidota bacterium]|nr:YCF48-related protein [Bacteroidota bacterium]